MREQYRWVRREAGRWALCSVNTGRVIAIVRRVEGRAPWVWQGSYHFDAKQSWVVRASVAGAKHWVEDQLYRKSWSWCDGRNEVVA